VEKQSPSPDVFNRWKRHTRWLVDQTATSIQNEQMKPFGQIRKVPDFTDWLLAGDAMPIAPVSGPIPANRAPRLQTKMAALQRIVARFPTQINRGKYFRKTGNSF
jgi:hypothetical protein